MIRVRINFAQHAVQQHDADDTTTRKSDQGKAWPLNTTGTREAEDDIQQQTLTPENNAQGLGEQLHSSNEATEVSRKTCFTSLKILIH